MPGSCNINAGSVSSAGPVSRAVPRGPCLGPGLPPVLGLAQTFHVSTLSNGPNNAGVRTVPVHQCTAGMYTHVMDGTFLFLLDLINAARACPGLPLRRAAASSPLCRQAGPCLNLMPALWVQNLGQSARPLSLPGWQHVAKLSGVRPWNKPSRSRLLCALCALCFSRRVCVQLPGVVLPRYFDRLGCMMPKLQMQNAHNLPSLTHSVAVPRLPLVAHHVSHMSLLLPPDFLHGRLLQFYACFAPCHEDRQSLAALLHRTASPGASLQAASARFGPVWANQLSNLCASQHQHCP